VPAYENQQSNQSDSFVWESINILNMSFSYDGGRGVENISTTLKKGSATAIIGRSGSGKTTFINVLLGLILPDSGELKLDQKEIDLSSRTWRNLFGYVPQNIALLDDTIRRNIAFGIPDNDISDEKLTRAVKLAQLAPFIHQLTLGLETVVGENGARISGGQKQRIGIARALYNDPEVLVFDEATSALDMKTEAEILNVLIDLKRSKTLVLVTHRISSIEFCDRVLVFENGKIRSAGTFAEVSKKDIDLLNVLEPEKNPNG
jgi:ATP-binding cassette, subfamily B, bacterial PglK